MTEDSKHESVWEYVSPEEYRVPSDTVKRTLSTRISNIWKKLRRQEAKTKLPDDTPTELKSLTQQQLRDVLPKPDWQDTAVALKNALSKKFLNQRNGGAVLTVVGAPFSGQANALVALAESQGWQIVPAPSVEQILSTDPEWLDTLGQAKSPWVLPFLERCFLRHEKGMRLVRAFLTDVFAGRFGKVIIGCNSWSWSYLNKVCAETTVIPAITPQALDAHRLQHWLSLITFNKRAAIAYRFQLPGEASELLPALMPSIHSEDESSHTDSYFLHTAALSRGIAGIAWSIWESGLRKNQENTVLGGDKSADVQHRVDPATVIRVLPWNELTFPSIPSIDRPAGALILHALMIHGGLPDILLPDLMPLKKDHITKTIFQLRSAGVVEYHNKRWYVTPLGYPAVRSYLRGENYLTDLF